MFAKRLIKWVVSWMYDAVFCAAHLRKLSRYLERLAVQDECPLLIGRSGGNSFAVVLWHLGKP